jgi:hypothetical protein
MNEPFCQGLLQTLFKLLYGTPVVVYAVEITGNFWPV